MHLTDGELCDVLTSPRVDQLREPTLIVAKPDGTSVAQRAVEALTSLPTIVVGDGHDPDDPPAHVDLVIEPGVSDLDAVCRTIAASPIAATTLALVLRAGPYRSVAAGLVAESTAYSTLQAGPEFARWRRGRAARERPPDTGPAVRLARDGDRLDVVLDRPHVRNALNRSMRDQLLEAFSLAAADDGIATVEVRGEGPSFCSGGDLDEFGTFDDPASANLVRLTASIGRAIDAIADEVTFYLHGTCAGSGIELPAFARRVVADRGTTFALPEIGLGLIPGAGGTVSLTARAGRHRVALLALCGQAIDAATARRWHLVDEIGV